MPWHPNHLQTSTSSHQSYCPLICLIAEFLPFIVGQVLYKPPQLLQSRQPHPNVTVLVWDLLLPSLSCTVSWSGFWFYGNSVRSILYSLYCIQLVSPVYEATNLRVIKGTYVTIHQDLIIIKICQKRGDYHFKKGTDIITPKRKTVDKWKLVEKNSRRKKIFHYSQLLVHLHSKY
jgi:hypothetical protein